MHEFTPDVEALADQVLAYSLERLKSNPPLDGPRTEADLFAEVGNTVTANGLGGKATLDIFTEVLAKACILEQALYMADLGKKVQELFLRRIKPFVG
jgi:hypothetical protein